MGSGGTVPKIVCGGDPTGSSDCSGREGAPLTNKDNTGGETAAADGAAAPGLDVRIVQPTDRSTSPPQVTAHESYCVAANSNAKLTRPCATAEDLDPDDLTSSWITV